MSEDAKTGYNPSLTDAIAAKYVNEKFSEDAYYWQDIHEVQLRLYQRYRNAKLRSRGAGKSDIQISQAYYIVDVISSFITQALLADYPFAKISAIGVEDFAGKQAIDIVNGFQHRQRCVKWPLASALRDAVITGTGVLIPKWGMTEHTFIDKRPKVMTLVNPNDPFGQPIQVPTGQFEYYETKLTDDRFELENISSWNVFPAAGTRGDIDNAHHVIFKVKLSRTRLIDMEKSGYISNLKYVDEGAYGTKPQTKATDTSPADRAKREDKDKIYDKESLECLVYWGKFPIEDASNYIAGSMSGFDEQECIIIKPLNCDVILKCDKNPYQSQKKPCIMIPYEKLEEELWGFSPLWMAEKLLQHSEDMFNMTQDVANREIYHDIYVPERQDTSKMKQRGVDNIIPVPDEFFANGKWPVSPPPNQYIMPNLMEQKRITNDFIYEVTSAIDIVRGVSGNPSESATKSSMNWHSANNRFKARLQFLEERGIEPVMNWQMAMNHQFLEDDIVELLTGLPPEKNPFKMIVPTIPIMGFDWQFDGSKKASENPIKAQLLRGILDILPLIPPGQDETGRYKAPNGMAVFREYLKNLDVTDNLEKFFIDITPDEYEMRMQALSAGAGGGRHYDSGSSMGATSVGDIASGVNKPTGGYDDVKMRGMF